MTAPAALALHLAHNIHAIANHEHAGRCYHDIKNCIDNIENTINRPIPARFLGPCPTQLTDNYGQRICNTQLTAARNDEHIQCPTCKTTHQVTELHDQQMRTTDAMSFKIGRAHV